jgi:hypothetical protein
MTVAGRGMVGAAPPSRNAKEIRMADGAALNPELKQKHRKMWASGDYPDMVETFPDAAGAAPGRVL